MLYLKHFKRGVEYESIKAKAGKYNDTNTKIKHENMEKKNSARTNETK